MLDHLFSLAEARASGNARGIYSICSAHPLVIEAAMVQAIEGGTPLLVEATSNQVDQFGGYTGMRPADFRTFVLGIATKVGLPQHRIILGGDHLGPNPWRNRPATEAMAMAEELLSSYAAAGFTKLHLDASMACEGDPDRLDDSVVAERAARLCKAAEQASSGVQPVYVIGTEVPVPGGAAETLETVEVTARADARRTLQVHQEAFERAGLASAWRRVLALVVQPGVEFDHQHVVDYVPSAAADLKGLLSEYPHFVFEAHSTDYQRPDALAHLVQDGFAVLKVGPAVTFALREALYSLAAIEDILVPEAQRSHLPSVVESVMLAKPVNWSRYYHGNNHEQRMLRVYSYSDRIRYYWAEPTIESAVGVLLSNLSQVRIPENVLSQFMPTQYAMVRAGTLELDPRELVLSQIREAIKPYAAACWP